MSYFKVIVDKDKFSLYDTSKDKYYVVEPNDIDHILNPDNPYNDDGSLNLLSYSDVVNYFNRKYSKRKPTKGYTAKKANLKKEYSDVAKLNRRGEISKKIQSINISDENKRMIEKYPISEVVDLLNITPNQKAAIRNILNDSNFKLDKDETNEIKQEFLRDKSLDIQKKATTDQLNAMNLNQLNQAAQLNQMANNLAQNQQNQAAELQNITNELNRNRVNFDNRVNQLTANQQAANNQLMLYNNAFQNYQRNMAAQLLQMDNNFNGYIQALQADVQRLPDGAAIQNAINNANWLGNIQNALAGINNSINLLPKTADVQAIQDHVDRINGFFKQLPSAEQLNQIQGSVNQMQQKLLTMDIPNNAEQLNQITDSVNNLGNAIRQIKYPDYTQNLQAINDKLGMIAVHNNMIENQGGYTDELQNNMNDNIAQATVNNGNVENAQWTDNSTLPVDALRHHNYKGHDISVPHSIMRLINVLPNVNHNLKIRIEDMSGDEQYRYDIKPFGEKKLEFNVIQQTDAPFADLLHEAITHKKEWTADELVNYVTKHINDHASSTDIESKPKNLEKRFNSINWHFDDSDPMNNDFYTEDLIKFATVLPSKNRTIKYDTAKKFETTFTDILNNFVINPNDDQDHLVKLSSNKSFDSVGDYIYDNLTRKIFNKPVVGFETEGDDLFSTPNFQAIDDVGPETVKSDVEKVTTGILKSYVKIHPDEVEITKKQLKEAAKDYLENLSNDTAPSADLTYHYSQSDPIQYGRPKHTVDYVRAKNARNIIEHIMTKFNETGWDEILANYKIHGAEMKPPGVKYVRPLSLQNEYGITDQNNVYVSDENFAPMAYRSMNSNDFRMNRMLTQDNGELDYSSDVGEGGKSINHRLSNILINRINKNKFASGNISNHSPDRIISILMKKF